MSVFSDDNALRKFKSGTEAFDAKKDNNRLQNDAFKGNTPNIVNDKGYNIPVNTNLNSEQIAQSETIVEEADTPIANQIKNKTATKSATVNSVPLFHQKSNGHGTETSAEKELIHYDFLDDDGNRIFEHENPLEHDKYAKNIHSTNAGGGARFEASFDENGNLQSKIFLNKGKDRTDKKGFKNKAISFPDKATSVFEDIRPEENDALESFTDTKIETVLQHSSKRHLRKRDRFKDIKETSKEDIKQLKKEIKAEQTEKKKQTINSYFNQSNASFTNNFEEFSDQVDENFHVQQGGSSVQTQFLETKKQDAAEKSSDKNQKNIEKDFNKDTVAAKFETRELNRQEKLEQSTSENKAAKKSERKEVRKAAAYTAAAKMFEGKRDIQNQLGDMSGQSTGDLIKDGSSGLLKTITSTLKQSAVNVFKGIGGKIIKYLASFAAPLFVPICFIFLIVAITMATFSAVGGLLGSDSGESYDLDVNGDGYLYTSLTDETINNIIAALYENYSDMGADREQMLRYALSKVGCAYDQAYHGNLRANIFDCSSLAYRAYRDIGINISNNGAYSAAEECRAMMNAGKTVSGEMKPGDLIFYGGSDNGRYMGIYHVAIYVGRVNGVDKMVEARGTNYGVVYCDVRSNNVVNISRPI